MRTLKLRSNVTRTWFIAAASLGCTALLVACGEGGGATGGGGGGAESDGGSGGSTAAAGSTGDSTGDGAGGSTSGTGGTDGAGGSDTGSGGTGEEKNAAPVATGASFETTEAVAVVSTIVITDDGIGGGPLSLVEVTAPTFGSLSIEGDEITYTPNAGFFGTDFVEVAPFDGQLQGDTVKIEFTVTGSVFYVGADGVGDDDEMNSGLTQEAPLASLAEASSRVSREGDRIVLLEGTHTMSTVNAKSSVPFHVSGIASAEQKDVIIDLETNQQIYTSGASLAHFSNFTIQGGKDCIDISVPTTVEDVTISGCDTGATVGFKQDATFRRVTFVDNSANVGAGLVAYSGGEITIEDCLFEDNSSVNGGGALEGNRLAVRRSIFSGNASDGAGGAVFVTGEGSFEECTFQDNQATSGGALWLNDADVIIERSLFRENTATNQAGAIRLNMGSTLKAIHSTFTGNAGNSLGATIASSSGDTIQLAFCTIKDSVVESTADGALGSLGPYGDTELWYTVLDNPDLDDCNEFADIVLSTGSLSRDASCGAFAEAQQNVSIGLGPLQDNGGPTLTHLPGAASPLVDGVALVSGECPVPTFAASLDGYDSSDQRGTARPQGSACDVGAVER